MAGEFRASVQARLEEVKAMIAVAKDEVTALQATLDQAQARLASLKNERDEMQAYLNPTP